MTGKTHLDWVFLPLFSLFLRIVSLSAFLSKSTSLPLPWNDADNDDEENYDYDSDDEDKSKVPFN